MPLYLGVDDTDSREGRCTTFLATELVRSLRDLDLVGLPRLVRLNPNVPWKTRGNGAVCLRLGRGRGRRTPAGRLDGRLVWAYERGDRVPITDALVERIAGIVERGSALDDPTTHPAFVLLEGPAPPSLYWRAVREIVEKREALLAIEGLGVHRAWKEGRGVIGASAATAWRPRDRTYEVLAYRHPSRWGSRRGIQEASVRFMDRAFPSTFSNYDTENGRVVVTPRSPCPVLCGIRGDRPWELPVALATLRGEAPERWLLFETNQGTDDHVLPHPGAARPRTSIVARGRVAAAPRTLAGGHVLLPVWWRGLLDVVAYEPSKQFRRVVRSLAPGDTIRVVGSVRDVPRSLNLEKIEVLALAPVPGRTPNPSCPACGRSMKSSGRAAPYRCRRCGTRSPRPRPGPPPRSRGILPGWYEPPAGSRRHLARPLKRLGSQETVVGRMPIWTSPNLLAEPNSCLLPHANPAHGYKG